MAKRADPASARILRIAKQRLEGLHRAGVGHVRKVKGVAGLTAEPAAVLAVKKPPLSFAPPAHSPVRGEERQPPVPKPSPKPIVAEQAKPLLPEPPPACPMSGNPAADLATMARRVAACTRCAELATTRTQTVFGTGSPQPRLVFLGEAPGADEDRQGAPFVGRAGQLLTDMIQKGMRLRREDVYILNILKCRPPGNRTPLPDEAANCREYLDGQLSILRPDFLCCLGACAAQNLLASTVSISQMRGRFFEYQGIQVLCTYHPAYLLRNPNAKRLVWEDLQILMKAMGLDVPGK